MEENKQKSLKSGFIVKSNGGLYTVRTDEGLLVDCRAKGAFRKVRTSPLSGDRVNFELLEDNTGFIVEIMPRKNSLIRPAAANIDLLVVVAALKNPETDLFVLDKLISVAVYNKIEVLLVINKCDLADPSQMLDIYRRANVDTVCVSTKQGEGFEENFSYIKNKLEGKLSFFTGASGVGKSSLINTLYPDLSLSTGELSTKINRGKHTTRLTEIFCVDEKTHTFIGDTPGFSMLDIAGFGMFSCDDLLLAFPDIGAYATCCKYKKCTHVCEDGCNVMKALRDGLISPSRHNSYKTLYNELKDIKPWDN